MSFRGRLLTKREYKIVDLYRTYDRRSVAHGLGISVFNVNMAVSRAYKKLGVHSKQELIANWPKE